MNTPTIATAQRIAVNSIFISLFIPESSRLISSSFSMISGSFIVGLRFVALASRVWQIGEDSFQPADNALFHSGYSGALLVVFGVLRSIQEDGNRYGNCDSRSERLLLC